MRVRNLALLAGIAMASHVASSAPLDDINQYADRCSAELGAGTGSYLPIGLLPSPGNFSDTREIPVFWNQKRITFEETDSTSGLPHPGTGHWEFLFDGNPGAIGFPDSANTVGRITEGERANLKCDFWSHVNTIVRACIGGGNDGRTCTGAAGCPGGTCATVPAGCFPGQRMLQREVGTCSISRAACNATTPCAGGEVCADIVVWSAVLRRQAPSRTGQAAFDPFHPFFFNNFDVIAFQPATGATCWFDTLQSRTLQNDNWWMAAPGTPAGVPRPGGKDTAKKARAVGIWDRPELVRNLTKPGERCPACHGTGPILVSRWINQGGLFADRRNREIPFWHTAKLFERSFFKRFGAGAPAEHCGDSCHNYWSVSAETTPGGFISDEMTKDATLAQASNFRLQLVSPGTPFARTCRSGPKAGQPCAVDANCAPGTCVAGQHAGTLREMPRPYGGTPAEWDMDNLPGYNAMKACLRACVAGDRMGEVCEANADCPPAGNVCRPIDAAACSDTAQATIPTFYGAQGPVPGGKRQLILPPYEAVAVTFKRSECVVAPNGAENCKYLVEWRDPTTGESDYHAADKYYLVATSVANNPAQTPTTSRYCTTTNVEVTANKTPLPGSNWAMQYAADGTIGECRKTELRLCGGYAIDSAPNANDAHSPVDSRNHGDAHRGTLVTACANAVKIQRSGFRLHRATQRYVQTITLTNSGAQPIAGPITYLLLNLSANATLFGGGRTVSIVPAGTPYVNTAESGLAAGATIYLQLEFTNPTNQGITYDARVRTGAGSL